MLITTLTIVHGLIAVALLGAVSHQAVAAGRQYPARGFLGRFRAVDPGAYTNAVVVLFVTTAFLGAILYPQYRLVVRPFLESADLRAANGAFEIKEQFAALGLGMLPAYWALWRRPLHADWTTARRGLTWFLTGIVWWNFIVGHILNNIQGLFLWNG